jgi:5-methyltetrahydrofolate--homocysteine methyltransferase
VEANREAEAPAAIFEGLRVRLGGCCVHFFSILPSGSPFDERCHAYLGDYRHLRLDALGLDILPIDIIKKGFASQEWRRIRAESQAAEGHQKDMTRNPHPLGKILDSRIAIIDGAMGTTIRTYGMTEADIRGERFKDSTKSLLNNGDLFSLTKPEMIGDIHRRFLEAGADIIETNTFGATSITQSEFFVEDPRERGGRKDPAFYQKVVDDPFLGSLAWDINEQSARQCREWADRVGTATSRQRFVAGAIGPLTVSLSNSPDADDPGFRVVTFDQVKAAYTQQVRALIAGGVDLLLVETIFDSLNAKAALVAIREVFDKDGKELPVMISAAVGRGGETMISAQTTEAFWNAVRHVKPLSVGLNCSLGPDLMYPFLEELSEKADVAISCYPNAGLPNPLSETGFDLGPQDMARYLGDFARGGLINIAGGCCGNTPEHIAAIAKALEGQPPRKWGTTRSEESYARQIESHA